MSETHGEEAERIARAQAMLTPEKVLPFMMLVHRLARAYIGTDETRFFVVPKDWEPQELESFYGHKLIYTDVVKPGVMITVGSLVENPPA